MEADKENKENAAATERVSVERGLSAETELADFSPPPGLLEPPVVVSPPPAADDVEGQEAVALLQDSQEKNDAQGALKVLADMKAADQHITYSLYLRVIKVCVGSGVVQDAQVVMEEMRGMYTVDVVAYNVVLKAHASKGRFDK